MIRSRLTVLHASTQRHEEWNGNARYIRIVIHPSQDNYNLHVTHEGSLGCFEPAHRREKYDRQTKSWRRIEDPHFGGVMRLIDGHLQYGIIAHECVHAAANIWRMDVSDEIQLGDDCGYREEGFAYLVGDLVHETTTAIQEWKEATKSK
jgi:hypothetical protein